MTHIENLSRRGFLKSVGVSGGVFVVGTAMPSMSFAYSESSTAGNVEHQLSVFVSIAEDGIVTLVNHRSEMGQGIRTSIPQIIAEELNANWDYINVVQAQADRKYGSQGTAGSGSIRRFFTHVRQLGAVVRDMLEQAAANIWQVNKSEVSANNHFVVHNKTGQKIAFGELAKHAAKLEIPAPENVKLKSINDFSLIGTDVKQVDLPTIIAGKMIYSHDVQLPDMLIASIERPPVVGGKVKSFDATAAKKVKGVVDVIQLKERSLPAGVFPKSGIAVVATNTWAAIEGRKKLKVVWVNGENQVHNSESYRDNLKKLVNKKGINVNNLGDVYQHDYDQSRTVEATYSVPYLHHAPMETPAATAVIKDGGCIIWAGSQNPQWGKGLVLEELGLSREQADKVEFNVVTMGGAFGRKSKGDYILEAVELAKVTSKPVKVIWSREDDIQHGFYHSVSANYCKAELTNVNSADNWIQRVALPPIGWLFNTDSKSPSDDDLSVGFADTPFKFNQMSMEKHEVSSHIRPGWMRSVSCINNSFALGSFVDELANKAKITTQQMWLNLLAEDRLVDPNSDTFKYTNYGVSLTEHPLDTARMKNVINLLADKANIDEKVSANEGWGISFFRSFNSYMAAATKVSVKNKKVTILEMHTAVDCGIVITPDRVKSQMEGAMTFGLALALMGEITVKDGKIEQGNFHNYLIPRINQVPNMFVHIVKSNHAPGGIGEPGVPAIAPSIVNAIFHACGTRIRDLPVSKVLSI